MPPTCTYASALGKTMGLEGQPLIDLGLAAFLHDLGKTRVPQAILDKPSALTSDELLIIRHHPEWGLEQLGADQPARSLLHHVILGHHERLDGSGYPNKLKDLEIMLPVRLVSLVDVYDALTGTRPYRSPLTSFGALLAIKSDLTSRLDRSLFVAFVKMLGNSRA